MATSHHLREWASATQATLHLGGWLGWQPRPFHKEAKIQAWFQNWTQWEQKITYCRVTGGATVRAPSDTVVSRFTGFEEFFGTAPSRATHNCYFGKESPRVESSIVASTSANACNTICSSELLLVTS